MGDLIRRLVAIDEEPVDKGYLCDWYINSVSSDDTPVWTEEHIDELVKDFVLYPKEQEGDKKEIKEGEWIYSPEFKIIGHPFGHYKCNQCQYEVGSIMNFCPNCGADMRGESNG